MKEGRKTNEQRMIYRYVLCSSLDSVFFDVGISYEFIVLLLCFCVSTLLLLQRLLLLWCGESYGESGVVLIVVECVHVCKVMILRFVGAFEWVRTSFDCVCLIVYREGWIGLLWVLILFCFEVFKEGEWRFVWAYVMLKLSEVVWRKSFKVWFLIQSFCVLSFSLSPFFVRFPLYLIGERKIIGGGNGMNLNNLMILVFVLYCCMFALSILVKVL